jgi:hypothetical protein
MIKNLISEDDLVVFVTAEYGQLMAVGCLVYAVYCAAFGE